MSGMMVFFGVVVVPFLLFVLANAQVDGKDDDFRHEYFATYFLPHTRDSWDKKSCTKEELMVMLKLVSSKFNKIYTPTVGTMATFGSWKYYHYECVALTAYVAAEINSQANALLLQVAVGVDIGRKYLEKEMENALDVAKAANNLYPGTVSAITIWLYIGHTNHHIAQNMLGNLQEFREKVKESGLEFGLSEDACETLDGPSRELFEMMDYILCWYTALDYPSAVEQPEKAFSRFNHSAEIISGFSNVTRVLGRTSITTFLKDPNVTAEYWMELSRLARINKRTVVVGFPIVIPWTKRTFRGSAWWTQVKEEILDESAFAEQRFLPPSQNKFITKGLTDLWKAESIDRRNISFDQKKFRVLFRPANKIISDPRNYTSGEIVTMLELVATRFHYIITFRMGPMGVNDDWSQGTLDGVVAYAASLVNKQYGELKLRIMVGTSIDNPDLELVELRNAIQVTEIANAEFPGTVMGIQLWSYQHRFNSSIAMNLLKSKFAVRARELQLRLGIRLEDCATLDRNSKPLLEMIDYIICYAYTFPNGLPKLEARRVYSYFEEAREYISNISPGVEFIGMTQYPNGMPKQSAKLVEYWLEINKLVKSGNFSIVVGEAFDVPLKSYVELQTSGWWKRVTEATGDASAFFEKLSLWDEDDTNISYPSEGNKVRVGLEANIFSPSGSSVENFVEHPNVSVVIAVVGGLLFICGIVASTIAYSKMREKLS